jgi:hypothetical protein
MIVVVFEQILGDNVVNGKSKDGQYRSPLGRSASRLPTQQERVVVSHRRVTAKPCRALRGL